MAAMTHERVETARQPKVRNDDIASAFGEVADILELEEDNPFRIRAYRNAARTLRGLGEEVADLIARGGDPDDLPGIGKDLAAQIREMISSGRLSKLDRLRPAGRLREQGDAIDRFNAENPGFTVLKGVEVDILPDGQLDLPDDALRRLDIVVAAIHSDFALSREKQTERILRALDNKYVSILAHPTGRLLLERDGYDIDLGRILRAARARGCFLEINAQPARFDLSDRHCRMAGEEGVKLSLGAACGGALNRNGGMK
jgi:hypothetical protein